MKVWIHLSEVRDGISVMHKVRHFRGVFETEKDAEEYLMRALKALGGEWKLAGGYPGYLAYDLENMRECIFEYDIEQRKQFDDPDDTVGENEKANEPARFTSDEMAFKIKMAFVRGVQWAADELLKVAIKHWTDGEDDLAKEVRRIQERLREAAADREFDAIENQAKESGG